MNVAHETPDAAPRPRGNTNHTELCDSSPFCVVVVIAPLKSKQKERTDAFMSWKRLQRERRRRRRKDTQKKSDKIKIQLKGEKG